MSQSNASGPSPNEPQSVTTLIGKPTSQTTVQNTFSATPQPAANNAGKSKYRALIFSGSLFIIFQLVALFIVFFAAQSYDDDATEVNAAGRQRMLSQRLAKSLYQLQSPDLTPEQRTAALKEVKLAHGVFDETLRAFTEGGSTTGFDWQSKIELRKYEVEGKGRILSEAWELWTSYSEKVQAILASPELQNDPELFAETVTMAQQRNLKLLVLMNELTVSLQEQSADRGKTLQTTQTILLLAVIANFLFLALGVVKRLKAGDQQAVEFATSLSSKNSELASTNNELESMQSSLSESHDELQGAYQALTEASESSEQRAQELAELSEDLSRMQQESNTIFDSVSHGLCLIGDDWKIGNQVSSAMYSIFETDTLTGRSFLELMRPHITEKDVTTLQSFLDLLFQPKTSSKQLEKFNPLKSIEVTLNWDGKSFVSKHLGFDFKRIETGGKIISVLITVMDVTDKVALENELKRSAEGKERQAELVLEITQSDRKELEIFLGKTEKELDQINETLRNSGISSDGKSNVENPKELLEEVFRRVHNIKGNSSLLGLNSVVESCTKVEAELDNLRASATITGDRFLSSLVELAYLRELLSEYDDLIHSLLKSFDVGKAAAGRASSSSNEPQSPWSDLQKLVSKVADDENKKVNLNLLALNTSLLNEDQSSEIKDVLIQLARNSVVHGIEAPEARVNKGKWAEGTIQINSSLLNAQESPLGTSTLQINFQDDGQGLDPDTVVARAIDMGLISPQEAHSLNDAQKVSLIFKPGFSSTEIADEHSGRGSGMDIIRDKIVRSLGGKMKLRYETGKLFELKILIPVSMEQSVALAS